VEFDVNRPTFLRFVRRCVYEGKQSGVDGKIVDTARMFVLKRTRGGKPEAIDDWMVGSNFDADKLVDTVIDAATEDVKGLDEACTYELLAFFGTSKIPGKRKTFKVDPETFEDEDEADERLRKNRHGTSKEFMIQALKHNDGYAKIHIVGTGETLKILRAQVADLMEQNRSKDEIIKDLVGNHVESVKKQAELTESLLSQDHKRKLELNEQASEHALKQATIKLLEPVASKAVMQMSSRIFGAGQEPPKQLQQANDSGPKADDKPEISDYAKVILTLENTFTDDAAFMKVVQSNVFTQEQIGLMVRLFQMAKAESTAAA
jgi:hypothetical protein